MKLLTTTAIALATLAVATPLAAQTAAPATGAAAAPEKKIVLSKQAGKLIVDLQKSVQANEAAAIPAKLAAAKAAAQSADDKFAIGQLQRQAATAANDLAGIAEATDYLAASGYLTGDVVASLYNAAGIKYFNGKDFARAVPLFQKASAADPKSSEAVRLLGEAQNSLGQSAQAASMLQRALQMATAAGQKPAEDDFKRAVSVAYNAKLPIAVDLGRQWVTAYPNAESWRNAIAIYRNLNRPGVQGSIDLLRLARAASGLTSAGDYSLYATAAAEQGNFNEAQAVIDEGLAAQKIKTSDPVIRDTVAGLRTKPKAKAAELEASAKTATTSVALVRIGDRFYGLGDYARAAELYRQAVAKGGDTGLANLHLGMALARAGDKAGATAALNAVTGPNADIAKYWLLYVGRAA
jgi:tetratricopeptide (TPR) repeat protein